MLKPSTVVQGTSPSSLLRSAVDSLSPSHQDLFFSLSSAGVPNATPGSRDDQVVMAIFQTNAIAAGANAAIFPGVARLNHGCSTSFNAVYSWRAAEEILVVHALKPIKEGQVSLPRFHGNHFGADTLVCTGNTHNLHRHKTTTQGATVSISGKPCKANLNV